MRIKVLHEVGEEPALYEVESVEIQTIDAGLVIRPDSEWSLTITQPGLQREAS